MFLIELGIIISVYTGGRAWRRSAQAAPKPAPRALAKTATQAEDRQHLTLGAVTVLSSSVGYVLYPPLSLVNLALITYNAVPMLDRAEQALRQDRQIQNDTYSALIAVLCLGTGQYFAGALHNALYHFGHHAVGQAQDAASAEVTSALSQRSERVWLRRDGLEIEWPLAQVVVGDVLVVSAGELLAVEGEVIQGRALIAMPLLNASPPVAKKPGDRIAAGSLLLSGQLQVGVTGGGADSQTQRLVRVQEEMQTFKTQLQLSGENWSDKAALPLLGLSLVTYSLAGLNPATALLFSAPTTTVRTLLSLQTSTHQRWAATQGILIKDGRVLEELPWIDTMVFDKTGTLTEAQPSVLRVLPCASWSENRLLQGAAAVERHVTHPIADALRQAAAQRQLALPDTQDSYYEPRCGVSAWLGEQQLHVGSVAFIQEITQLKRLPDSLAQAIEAADLGSFVLIAVDKQLQGAIELRPQLRPEVPAVLAELRQRGIRHLVLVSGDSRAACERLGQTLGFDAVYAEQRPQDKVQLVRRLQSEGRRVCFIGDGLNDALAMQQAQVSICLPSGADLSYHTAQIVLSQDNLSHLRDVFDVSAHLHLRLGSSLGFWVGFGLVNALCIPLLHFAPLQSSVLCAGAFGIAYQRARQPGWLARSERHALPVAQEPVIDSSEPASVLLGV